MSLVVLLLLNLLVLAFLSCSKAQAAGPPVTVTEFSDFQCPYCERAAVVVEQLRQTYGDNVKFVFKQMPLSMPP
jgi:protein-disulfide isomerase